MVIVLLGKGDTEMGRGYICACMCLCVCTKESTWVKKDGRKRGEARAGKEGVAINSSPFIEFKRAK